MEMPKTAAEVLEMVITEETGESPENTIVERAFEEGRRLTREECLEWLQQFTHEQKLLLVKFLRALHAECEQGKEKAS